MIRTRPEIERQIEMLERTNEIIASDFLAGHIDGLKWVIGEAITASDLHVANGG